MELKWLEDYLALVQQGGFSRAADLRAVTQPAFSRRIRSLESWMGVSLIDRSEQPLKLTEAGEAFVEQAKALRQQILACREQLKAIEQHANHLVMLTQHSLAIGFLPHWLDQLADVNSARWKVEADNLHDSIEAFLAGHGDFLMGYDSEELHSALYRDSVESHLLGADQLIPMASPKLAAELTQHDSVPLLSYPPGSYFGQRIELAGLTSQRACHSVYESALAEGLKAMAINSAGICWLPASSSQEALASGQLIELSAPFASIELPIRLYRLRGTHNGLAEQLWSVCQQSED